MVPLMCLPPARVLWSVLPVSVLVLLATLLWLWRSKKKRITRASLLSHVFKTTGSASPQLSIKGSSTQEDLVASLAQDVSIANLSQWLMQRPLILFLLGVNGSGKTTTIAKLIHTLHTHHSIPKSKIGVIGTDTFRAAAMQQLQKRIQNLGCDITISQDAKKPSTVLYQGLQQLGKTKEVILVDTSGRLHTDQNLMNELSTLLKNGEKWAKAQSSSSHTKNILICDGTHGQNLEVQVKTFSNQLSIDAMFFTKIDCVAEKGPFLATFLSCHCPLLGLGTGEHNTDLWQPSAQEFVKSLCGI